MRTGLQSPSATVFKNMSTPLVELNRLSAVLKENIKQCAKNSASVLDYKGKTYQQARQHFFTVITEIEEYERLQMVLEDAYQDCAKRYKMEYWWVVSMIGINLQKDLLSAFDEWWGMRCGK